MKKNIILLSFGLSIFVQSCEIEEICITSDWVGAFIGTNTCTIPNTIDTVVVSDASGGNLLFNNTKIRPSGCIATHSVESFGNNIETEFNLDNNELIIDLTSGSVGSIRTCFYT